MAFLGKSRSQRHYASGTSRLQSLSQGVSSSPIEDLDFIVISLRKAVELNPGFVEAHHNLGNAFLLGAEYNEAASALSTQDGKPGELDSLNDHAYGEALIAFDKAISLRQHFPEAHNNRGRALIKLWRFQDALEAFDMAIEQSPGYATAIENRELLLKLQRKVQEEKDVN